MKTLTKFFKPAVMIVVALALLTACKSMPLEEQILEGLNEPATYTFKYVGDKGVPQYLRIYDQADKKGLIVYEHGQKHPCNQGFIKTIKSTAPGLVQFAVDADTKPLACAMTYRYIFRVDANGIPQEGWANFVTDKSKEKFGELSVWIRQTSLPKYKVVK